MVSNRAARGSCSYHRAKGSTRTRSIIANEDMFMLAMITTAFVAMMLLIPTVMAAAKAAGWW